MLAGKANCCWPSSKPSKKSLQTKIVYDTMLATVAQEFIDWRDKLHSEMRGGKLMFDVPKHYKWLDESELFTYYMDIGRYYV